MSKNRKILQVSAIKNGTVIDHIPADNLFDVVSILNLQDFTSLVTFGTNFESAKLGRKAIIKIEDFYFREEEINKIALVAPQAKLNIIKNYEVAEKKFVEVPKEIIGIAKCVNPKCITNNEDVVTRFTVHLDKEVALKCHFCEKITDQNKIEII
jgi:aspartate carbamoyltransferase regulatory subunit